MTPETTPPPSAATARWPFLFHLLLFIAALAVRLVYLRDLAAHNPLFDTVPPSVDHYNFDQSAINFAAGDWLARAPNNSYAPLYKYFLGVIYSLFGRNFHIVYGIQFALGALAAVLLYRIGETLFSPRAGLFAWLAFALHAPEITFEGTLMRDAFIAFCGVLSLYLILRFENEKTPAALVIATLGLSLFFQGRPNTLLCLPGVCYYLHRRAFSGLDAATRKKYRAIFTATLLLSFAPLLVQCYLVHGRFVLFDASGPHTFISGNLVAYSGAGFDDTLTDAHIRRHGLGYSEDIRFLVRHVAENPWEFVKLYGRKLFYFFNDYEPPTNISIYLYQELSPVLRFLPGHFALISALALAGLVFSVRAREKRHLLPALYLLSLAAAILLFLNEDRYRVPIVPVFILFAAHGLDRIIAQARARRLPALAGSLAATGILLWIFQTPPGAPLIRANDYGILGNAWMERGNIAQAETAFRQSLALDPNNPYAEINLGLISVTRQEWANAANHFARAVLLRGDLWEAHFNLALASRKLGDTALAEAALQKTLKLKADLVPALIHLAEIYTGQGRYPEAHALLLRATQVQPQNPELFARLAALHALAPPTPAP